MTFLPIVDRELRVASRRRGTFWLRVVAAIVGLVIGGGFMFLEAVSGVGTAMLGKVLFGVLTWLNLAAALSAGLFFTSDCLSEEKREGTLGFLFLTDLRGYDVVLGKLLATSLRGAYALLAVFPILAITLVMGGVTGAAFWKTVLALVNALLCSLAAGLLVSALSRDSHKAMSGTVLLLLLLVGAGPVADATIAGVKGTAFNPTFSLVSPGFTFVEATTWAGGSFWPGLLVSQAVAWLLLGAGCWLVPRAWQEKRRRASGPLSGWRYRWKYGGPTRRLRLRRKLIDRNPALWLGCRERWQSASVWALALIVLGALTVLLCLQVETEWWAVWSFASGLFALMLYLWAATQAGRFFVEARRTGVAELMLETPLSVKEIVQGQWRALLRVFGLPVALFLGTQLVAGALSHQAMWGSFTVMVGSARPNLAMAIISSGVKVLGCAVTLISLSWFGMWMGLTSKSVNLAALKTLLLVCVIPWLVISFVGVLLLSLVSLLSRVGSGPAIAATFTADWYLLLQALVPGVLGLGKDIGFILWSRQRLYSAFRDRISSGGERVIFVPRLPPQHS